MEKFLKYLEMNKLMYNTLCIAFSVGSDEDTSKLINTRLKYNSLFSGKRGETAKDRWN